MSVAYSYIRFSTTEQKKGDSLRRQTELSEQYALKHGLTLDTTLHLHDLGLSAFDRSNIDRGALGGFLEAVKRGRIVAGSYLLVESLDRLSRDKVLDALEIFSSILRQGITIVTLADNMVYNQNTIAGNVGNLIISITIMARAHEESAIKSSRIKAAWEGKRSRIDHKKLTAQCPRWLRLNADKTAFDFIPERVAIIREIIELHRTGLGQAQIAKRLNERGEPPFSNHGKGWHSSYIQKILTGTAIYGEFQPKLWTAGKLTPHGDRIKDYYPALITEEEFHALASSRAERRVSGAKARKGTEIPNLFSGVAKCGYCGSTMILVGSAAVRVYSADGTESKRPAKKVLVCSGARSGLQSYLGAPCFAVQWGYNDFEKSFLIFCRTLALSELVNSSAAVKSDAIHLLSLSEKIDAICLTLEDRTKRHETLMTALEQGGAPTSIFERMRMLEDEIQALQSSKKQLQEEKLVAETSNRNRDVNIDAIHQLIDKLESLAGDERFTFRAALAERIRHIIKVIRVYPAGPLKSVEHIQNLRDGLAQAGYTLAEIETALAETRSEPKRTGRGIRGRFASLKDTGRHFTIHAKDGGFRILYPDFDDPSNVKVDLGYDGNLNAHRVALMAKAAEVADGQAVANASPKIVLEFKEPSPD